MVMKASLASLLAILITPLVVPAFSCEKRPGMSSMTEVTVPVDWSRCREVPRGMTVLIYAETGVLMQERVTPDVKEAAFRLPPGVYRAAVFPYSREEWSSLSVTGLSDLHTARVSPTDAEPPSFASACGQPFTVPAGAERLQTAPLIPEDKVRPLLIRVAVDGLPRLGHLSGRLSPACILDPFGNEYSFSDGIPLPDDGWERDSVALCRRSWLGPPDSLRAIHLLMARRDGSVAVDTVIDIRGRISPDGVLTLGDREGERFRIRGGGGGFEADIEDWTPGEETEIILHST